MEIYLNFNKQQRLDLEFKPGIAQLDFQVN